MALTQRSSLLNRILYLPLPESARPALLHAGSGVFRAVQRLRQGPHGPGPDLACEKIICPAQGFICFTVPKAGSSSLISLLGSLPQAQVLSISTAQLYREHPEWRGLPRFAFVRNPWARAVSAWQDKVISVSNLGKLRILSRYGGLRPGMGFREFVDWLASEEGSDAHADRHWISQHLLLGGQGVPVFHLEDMGSKLPEILAAHGVTARRIPHVHSTGGGKRYREHYDARLREKIALRYARDIELFGYAF